MTVTVQTTVHHITTQGYDVAADQARAAWAAVWMSGLGTFLGALASVCGAALAALFGAKYGARAARQMTKEADAERDALRSLRGLNVAMALIGSEVTAFFGLKKQHSIKAQAELDRVHKSFVSWRDSRANYGPEQVGPFPFDAEISEFGFTPGMMESAQEALLKDADADPTSIVLFGHLVTACFNARDIIHSLNDVVAEIRNMAPDAHVDRAIMYLGLPRPQGGTDARYPMLIGHLNQQINDVLIFGRVLCGHLEKRAELARAKLGASAPAIIKQDFRRMDELGLYPDETELRPVLAAAGVARFRDSQ
jgi:hypothetical protein